MSSQRSSCEMLKPALMAFLYHEEHPETGQLLEHLARCAQCREEAEGLDAVRIWVEAGLEHRTPVWGDTPLCKTRLAGRNASLTLPRNALAAAAVVLVIVSLFAGPSWSLRERVAARPSSGPGAGLLPHAPAMLATLTDAAVPAYFGEEIDGRIGLLSAEVAALREESW